MIFEPKLIFEKLYIANNLERDGKDIFYIGFTQGRLDEELKKLNESLDSHLDDQGYFELVKVYLLPNAKMQLTNIKKHILKKFHNKNIFKGNYFQCNPHHVIKKIENEIKPLGAIDYKTDKVENYVARHLKRFIEKDAELIKLDVMYQELYPYKKPGREDFISSCSFYYTYDNKKLILEHLIKKLMEDTSDEFTIDPEIIIIHEFDNEFHTGVILINFKSIQDYYAFKYDGYDHEGFWEALKKPRNEAINKDVPNFCKLFVTSLCIKNMRGEKGFINFLKNFGVPHGIAVDTSRYDEDTASWDYSDLDEDWSEDDEGLNHLRYYTDPDLDFGRKIRLEFYSIFHALFFHATSHLRHKKYPKFRFASINYRLEMGTTYEGAVAAVIPEDGEQYNNKLKLKWLGLIQSNRSTAEGIKLFELSKMLKSLMNDFMKSV